MFGLRNKKRPDGCFLQVHAPESICTSCRLLHFFASGFKPQGWILKTPFAWYSTARFQTYVRKLNQKAAAAISWLGHPPDLGGRGVGGPPPPIPFIYSSPQKGKWHHKWNSRGHPPSPNSILKGVGMLGPSLSFIRVLVAQGSGILVPNRAAYSRPPGSTPNHSTYHAPAEAKRDTGGAECGAKSRKWAARSFEIPREERGIIWWVKYGNYH